MATDNTVTLIGNLTDDPELHVTTNGAAVANFRLAVTDNPWRGSRSTRLDVPGSIEQRCLHRFPPHH
jgi:single-stranded DNA-binding protein